MPAPCCKRTMLKMLLPENDEEPVFLIRAQDQTAPLVVEEWLEQAEQAGADPGKLAAARYHLTAIKAWQAANPERVKVPD